MEQKIRVTHLKFCLLCATTLLFGACDNEGKQTAATQVAIEQTPEQKVAALLKLANKGDAGAQYELGAIYYYGQDVPKDFVKGAEWLEKAAAQGHAKAQTAIGVAYFNGSGAPTDEIKAAEWFQKAATQGSARAQFFLGIMHNSGKGVPKDETKGAEWVLKAATQGYVDAQAVMGSIYAYGNGVPKDSVKAAEWFQKAATQGNDKAQYSLGVRYLNGDGVPKDAAKAVEWFQKAATQGHVKAQYSLGLQYKWGDGVPKDDILAYAWINLAAGTGLIQAEVARLPLEMRMSRAALAEAQRISSSWKKGASITREGTSDTQSQSTSGGTPRALSRQGNGTAFLVAKTGHAITNRHVIDSCKEIRIQGRDGLAKLVTSDTVNDLALLQLAGTYNAVAPINTEASKLRQGDAIVVYGFPLNSVLSSGGNLTPGVVSAITGLGNNANQIQITAPIQPGSSGSPVLNKKGEVVGVVSMKLSDAAMANATGQVAQNVNFAVSGQTLRAFLDSNQVTYSPVGGYFVQEKSTPDLADEARKWTFLVECWK